MAATRAGAADEQGREALLKYILRPPPFIERPLLGSDGLVRIALKKPFSDGTVAVDLDPLSLLCRLVALVPAPCSRSSPAVLAEQDGTTTRPIRAVLAAGLFEEH